MHRPKTVLAAALALLLAAGGCAGKVTPEDRALMTSRTLQLLFEGMTLESLILMEELSPAIVSDMEADLQVAVATMRLIAEAGEVNAATVAAALSTVLARLDERIGFLPPREATRALRLITRAGEIANIYLESATLPESARLYAMALAGGIEDGLDAWERATRGDDQI